MPHKDTLERLRSYCLALPEVRETVKWNHPTFEAGKKIFAVLETHPEGICLALRVSNEKERNDLCQNQGFSLAPYWTHQGWVFRAVDPAGDWDQLTALILRSYRAVALKRMLAVLDLPPGQEPALSASA